MNINGAAVTELNIVKGIQMKGSFFFFFSFNFYFLYVFMPYKKEQGTRIAIFTRGGV